MSHFMFLLEYNIKIVFLFFVVGNYITILCAARLVSHSDWLSFLRKIKRMPSFVLFITRKKPFLKSVQSSFLISNQYWYLHGFLVVLPYPGPHLYPAVGFPVLIFSCRSKQPVGAVVRNL